MKKRGAPEPDHVQKLLQATRIKARDQSGRSARSSIRPTSSTLLWRSDRHGLHRMKWASRSRRICRSSRGRRLARGAGALWSLLENAAKYSTASSSVNVSAYLENEQVVFAVTLTGQGSSRHPSGRRCFGGPSEACATARLSWVPGSGFGSRKRWWRPAAARWRRRAVDPVSERSSPCAFP